jgi:hypothetical protein
VSRRPVAQGAGRREPIGNLLVQAEDEHISASTCIAYREDGTPCRAPASIFDHQRGGMVCLQHASDEVAEEIFLSLKMGTVVGRIDNEGEVYSRRLGKTQAFDTYHFTVRPMAPIATSVACARPSGTAGPAVCQA